MEEKNKPNHYYISLPSQKTEADLIDFEIKMLEQNQIRGLLPAAREYQDTEVKIYFDISGRQNLEQRYAWQKLKGWEVKQILGKIAEVAAELDEYMLDYNHLNLMPEFMYGMLNPEDLCFCYEPWDSDTFGERLRPLALWFLDHMDYREREEVIFSYEFQRFCEENDVSPALLGQFMAEKAGGSVFGSSRASRNLRKGERAAEERRAEKSGTEMGPQAEAGTNSEKIQAEDVFPWEEAFSGQAVRGETFSDANRRKNSGMKELFRRIFPAGGKQYPDFSSMDSLRVAEDETEYGRKTTRGRKNARSRADRDVDQKGDFMMASEESVVPEKSKKPDVSVRFAQDASFSELGEEAGEEQSIMAELISGKMPALHIRGFPCFLGSDGEFTDCEIAHESVSRIHARLFQADGSIWVEDLSSENGTFLNGDRMLPNEPWVLKNGDELRIGDCSYRFHGQP